MYIVNILFCIYVLIIVQITNVVHQLINLKQNGYAIYDYFITAFKFI